MSPPDQIPLIALSWTSEYLPRTTSTVLVERSRLGPIVRQANKHPTRFSSSEVLHHCSVMLHPLVPLARFKSMSRFHRFPAEPELSKRSRPKWEIRRTLVPSRPDPPRQLIEASPHDAPSRDVDDPKDRFNHATIRGSSPEVGHLHQRASAIRRPFPSLPRRVDPVGIVPNDLSHVRSEERGVSSRIALTPLKQLLSPRPIMKLLRRAFPWSFGSMPIARASPSLEFLIFQHSEKCRSIVFSRAELFRSSDRFFETHILRRKRRPLEIAVPPAELITRSSLSFHGPEGPLQLTEKLTLSSIKGSSANRPSVGFPSL